MKAYFLKKKTYSRFIELSSIFATFCTFIPIFFQKKLYNTMVPIHYNILGQVNRWGDKESLWILPVIALVFQVGLSIFAKYPNKLNYPIKITDENRADVYALGKDLMLHVKLLIIIIFAYINNMSFLIAMEKQNHLHGLVMIVLLGGVLITVFLFSIRVRRLNVAKK